MSTKKIHEALSAMRSCIKCGEPWTPEMEEICVAAKGELEDIKMAAKEWVSGTDAPHKAAWINEVAESIAKDAP